MEIRYAVHPEDAKKYGTADLRKHFLIENLFRPNDIMMTYSHVERMIIGGAEPVDQAVKLEADPKAMGTSTFLERREIGIFNIGGRGAVTVDGTEYVLDKTDCLYIGRGAKDVIFTSADAAKPAKFYFNSCPAHQTFPTVKLSNSEATARHLGSIEGSNERTIYQYIHEGGIKSSQLVMGMTRLNTGSMWNTMPCHTHNRRSEVYLYFDLPADGVVFHLMGEPCETRHLVVRNEQAVISPSWSIHSGVGTQSYTFIWGMAGDNQKYDDVDPVGMGDLF